MITIATTGGGTAGHVLPSIALYPELKKHFDRIIHVGGYGIEQDLIPKAGIKLYCTKNIKFDRKNLFNNLKIPFTLTAATMQAKKILKQENVSIVFGKGGYAMLPTIIGARKLNIPIVIHESDLHMGLANKLAKRFADLVLTSFPETEGGLFIGNPIRESIFNGNKEKVIRSLGLNRNKRTILFFGGSSGAEAINSVVFKIAKDLVAKLNVIHILGKREKRRLFLNGYHPLSYCDTIEDLYAISDVIVMRGGANSLQEATMLGKRIICIPLPKSKYSRGDQIDNAISYAKRGLIDLLPQEELNEEKLKEMIYSSLNKKEHPVNRDTPNKAIVKKILEVLNQSQRS